ncbi:mismatch repair protein [Trypanosoma brucei gambiense DAL972]|uniref:Mismatch repair protein MSH3, putative n=1 Tax=Trypanosoma brucei gambiense (strain MHOM/CI/86/DAL972) TaxID=679716 RepID=C9ZXQ8_TRYB9|nr:mismatch repair protein [Trypanosoma brucei gambiense DAL972]CBH14203.1 mismatch repair protein [Trypanosoma brucei gambiense DAL972]|eukprot:XP_011776473.1 mismatch repair protein [Trypanosoma brucei gambiense DAL972]
MSKRRRGDDESDIFRKAIELLCHRRATTEELSVATKLTPLERQVVCLKESLPPDVILMVACGYRVKFYGRDSRVVSRRFGIMCIQATPFEYSSVPYTGVNIYVRRLVAMGYRVAFADQESASIRSTSGNSKGLFSREIGRVYSRGTMLPDEVVVTAGTPQEGSATGQGDEGAPEGGDPVGVEELLPLKEGSSELFICFLWPSTGSAGVSLVEVTLLSFVTYSLSRHHLSSGGELLDILNRYNIVEVVLFYDEDGARELDRHQNAAATDGTLPPFRLCGLPEAFYTPLNTILSLHHGPTVNGEEDNNSVTVCTSPFIGSIDDSIAEYLKPSRFDTTFRKMCSKSPPLLARSTAGGVAELVVEMPGTTMSALDIFHSSIGLKGSLLTLLDHSLTVPGLRRLRSWLAAPLCDLRAINSRREAVAFLLRGEGGDSVVGLLREFAKFGDLEATLGKLRAQRCTVTDYLRLLRAVKVTHNLALDILSLCGEGMCDQIRDALVAVTSENVELFLQSCKCELNLDAGSPQEYYAALGSPLPDLLQTHAKERDEVLRALDVELECIRKTLKLPALEYRTIAGTTFIVDVPNVRANDAPKEWIVLTRTKTHVRFHTPRIVNLTVELCSAKERLAIAANEAWLAKQAELEGSVDTMEIFKSVINSVAVLDALHCLAVASSAPGYTAPSISDDEQSIVIRDGRHPMLESLMRGGYVGCDVSLVKHGAWILTGPNMGGKSALMRMVGTFVVLAQLGCYVPAKSAQLPLFGAVYCRMGSSDSLLEGSSTFLKEMEETSRILRSEIVSSSLVLLDELGRGTSSYDGIAIAAATLEYLLRKGATTFFVTHYSQLCEPYVNSSNNGLVSCYYMGFHEEKIVSGEGEGEGEVKIVFTYKPTLGVTPSSFGARVARMAGLPSAVVTEAQLISEEAERTHDWCLSLLELRRFVKNNS